MKAKVFGVCLAILLLSGSKVFSAPQDFQLVYFTSAGSMEPATIEKITVRSSGVVMERDAAQVGGSGQKVKDSKTYKVSAAQIDELYQMVQTSGILAWPAAASTPHGSDIEEYIEITANGKTVKRTRWETANLDKFRQFYADFNRWYTTIRSVGF